MKKMVSLLLATIIVFASATSVAEELYSIIDTLEYEDLVMVEEYITEKIEEIENHREPAAEVQIRMSADRSDQAFIGEPVFVQNEGFVITVQYAFQGTYADALAKSFDTYNTRYGKDQSQEWVLVYLKIEGRKEANEKIELSDYYFSIVDENGVECGSSYIADNPKEIRSMYGDSVQYAWYGMPVTKGTKVSMIYQPNIFGDEEQYWFDLSERYPIDTSNVVYPELKLKSKDEIVFDIQMMLGEYGCMVYAPSSVYDTNTQNAMKSFQKKVGLKATGLPDQESLQILFSGKKLEK